MAVAHDAAAVVNAIGLGNGGTITATLTIGSNSNRIVVGEIIWRDTAGQGGAPSSTQFGGNNMTLISSVGTDPTNDTYYYLNPSIGSQSMITTISDGTGLALVNARQGVESKYGAHQTTPLGSANTAIGTDKTPTVTLTGCAVDSMVVDQMSYSNGAAAASAAAGANQTPRWNGTCGAGSARFIGSASTEPVTVAGNITMSWAVTITTATEWTINAQEIRAAPTVSRMDHLMMMGIT